MQNHNFLITLITRKIISSITTSMMIYKMTYLINEDDSMIHDVTKIINNREVIDELVGSSALFYAISLEKSAIYIDNTVSAYQLCRIAYTGFTEYKKENYEEMNDAILSISIESAFFIITRFIMRSSFFPLTISTFYLNKFGIPICKTFYGLTKGIYCGSASAIDSMFNIYGSSFEVASCNGYYDNDHYTLDNSKELSYSITAADDKGADI